MNQTLLVELLTEELPPKALAKLGNAFAQGVLQGLRARDFVDAESLLTIFATPRRLALTLTQVRTTSPVRSVREKVLPISVALDATGNPSAPLVKKLTALAAAAGVPVPQLSDLERAVDGKADSFFFQYSAPGVA
ncbi:MAG: glycine--tRNA ligase subunit beta, partial [Pseudomonadota bacterium]|nr:glycine--tRNA ligase subunit beta [Pseudomonadota bacterium]